MKRATFLAAALCTLLTGPALARAETSPAVIKLPEEALVPDVAFDAKGTMHVVYASKDKNAYYLRSEDKGRTFSPKVQMNDAPVTFTMGERGPKLALGKDGAIHVAWMDFWSQGVKTYPRHARSVDGGKTFSKSQPVSTHFGVDGVTLAADDKGHVALFWHTMQPKQEKIPQATWLWMAQSKDAGETFSPEEQMKVSNLGTLACSMCMMRARVASDGDWLLAFRSAEDNIRDFYVLKGKPGENNFAAVRVNEDKWELKTCPMCGPEMSATGRPVVAFMSRNKAYWSVADAKLGGFKIHAGTPAEYNDKKDEMYPAAAMNSKGEVLMVWQNGPMSTKGTATVRWAPYKADGSPDGKGGTLGMTTSGTKAIVIAGPDDRFYVLTTAQVRKAG